MFRNAVVYFSIAAGIVFPSVVPAGGSEPKSPFALELRTGAEYDSNVAVLELDSSTGASDVASVTDFHAGYGRQLPKSWSFDVAYDFSQSLYRQFDAYDLRIHHPSAGFGYDFGPVETGMNFQYVSAALAGGENMTLRQLTPHVGRLFGTRLYTRLAWDRTEKRFDSSPGRDAATDAPTIDAFVFVDGVKSYFVFGFQHVDENAADDAFDYRGGKLKAQYTHRFTWGFRSLAVKPGLRYESREYRAAHLPLASRREDRRYRAELELEAVVSRHLFLRGRYEYARNRSTEASVDFSENVVSIGLGARL